MSMRLTSVTSRFVPPTSTPRFGSRNPVAPQPPVAVDEADLRKQLATEGKEPAEIEAIMRAIEAGYPAALEALAHPERWVDGDELITELERATKMR